MTIRDLSPQAPPAGGPSRGSSSTTKGSGPTRTA